GGLRREFRTDAREERPERDFRALGNERTGVEARQVDQLRELDLQRAGRRLDVCDERAPLGVAGASGERRNVQPERVQRLAQIVAGGGKQLALRAVRRFRRGSRIERASRLVLEL